MARKFILLFYCFSAVVIGYAQEVAVFPQVSGKIQSAVFSPDDRYVLTGDSAGAVKVWDVETGALRASYYGHEKMVKSVAWSPDGKLIASGSWDNTIRIWDAPGFTGQAREPLRHEAEVFSVAFSPDSRLIASGSADRTVRIWDAEDGREIHELRWHGNTIFSVAFDFNGKRVVSASADRTMMIWDAEAGKRTQPLRGHPVHVNSAAWSPDGKLIVSASNDKTVRVWDAETRDVVRVIGRGVYDDDVYQAKFSPDGKRIVTVGGFITSQGRGIMIWDAETGAEIRRFAEHTDTIVSAEWDADGKRIVTASYDNTSKIYNAETGKCLKTFAGRTDMLNQAALSRDGKRMVTGSEGKKVNIWNARTGVLERKMEHDGKVKAVAISPDSRLIAAGGMSYQIMLWDAETGNELRAIRGHRDTVFAMTFNPANGFLASASADKTIRIWNPDTGRVLDVLSGHEDAVSSLAFSEDGKRLVSGSYDKTVVIWELAETGQYRLLRKFAGFFTGHRDYVNSVTLNSSGTKAASASRDGTVRLWDTETGQGQTLTSDIYMNDMWSVTFSPDDCTIIAGSSNGVILKWELDNTGTYSYKGAKEKLLGIPVSLSYVSNGTRILAGILDGTARLYNAEDLSEIASFISFSGSDSQLVSASRDITPAAETAVSSIDGEWVVITPDGYYAASPRGDRYLNVRIGSTVTGIDSFRSVFYNPDVVRARLAGQLDPVSKKTITIQQAAVFMPPDVSVQTQTRSASSSTTNISVSITDKNLPVQNIIVMVNGRRLGKDELSAVSGASGLQPGKANITVTGNQKTLNFSLPVNLDPGDNRIEVVAFNGYSENRRYVDINWNAPVGNKPKLPDLYILAIGVNKYDNPGEQLGNLRNLDYCVADARGVIESLKAQEGIRYGKVNSLLIADNADIQPTAENIRKNLGFLETAGPKDVALLFLAGHGVSAAEGKFYFLPRDAVITGGTNVTPNRAISGDEIVTVLDAPGNRLVFIDACKSGGVDNDRMVRLFMDTNAFVFAACRGNESSLELPNLGHGVFTYSVMDALKGAAGARAADNVSVKSMSGFVSIDVPERTGNRQHPSAYSLGFYDFPVAVIK